MMGPGSFVRLGLDQLLYLRALVHQREVRMGFAMLTHISTFMPPKLTCTQNINWIKINDRDVRTYPIAEREAYRDYFTYSRCPDSGSGSL